MKFLAEKTGSHQLTRGIIGAVFVLAGCASACDRSDQTQRIVIYTSVDQRFAQEVLRTFSERTGLRVDAVYDSEAGKTTGFLRRLERERRRPRCDVWWSSEVFGTIELARAGLFEEYEPATAADIPAPWRDAENRWTALAARARVVAFDPARTDAASLPTTWAGFADEKWRGRIALANPQFGTTRGHVATLFAYWGESAATTYLQDLRDYDAKLADGNAHTVRMLAAGSVELAWTDSDDARVARERGESVEIIYPRLSEEVPVVWIPCSVALVKGGPNTEAAKVLIDFLVGAEVEQALAESSSQNVPVREDLRRQVGWAGPAPVPLDFERVADALPRAMEIAREILLQ